MDTEAEVRESSAYTDSYPSRHCDATMARALGTFLDPSRIIVLNEKKRDTKQRKSNTAVKSGEYILCTRYQLQSEMKRLFEYDAVAELQAYKKE